MKTANKIWRGQYNYHEYAWRFSGIWAVVGNGSTQQNVELTMTVEAALQKIQYMTAEQNRGRAPTIMYMTVAPVWLHLARSGYCCDFL